MLGVRGARTLHSVRQLRTDLPQRGEAGARRFADRKDLLSSGRTCHCLAGSIVCGAVSRHPAGAVDSCAQIPRLLCRIGNSAGRAAGFGQHFRADEQRDEADADLFRMSGRGGFDRQVLSGMPALCFQSSISGADALQDAARALRRRHCDCLYRALHCEEKEAEAHPELLDVALTFEDLDRWLTAEKISLPRLSRRMPTALSRRRRRKARSTPSMEEWLRA